MSLDFPDSIGKVEVYEREEVKLPCRVTAAARTNVTWLHRDNVTYRPPRTYNIYLNGYTYRTLPQRFIIDNATARDYSLTILDIHHTDAGRYRCFNHQQLIESYYIRVFSKYRY